ncbi:hypothetical protein AOC36_02680 [Erysipelothrix larvae]|uniref:YitT family protein n=1 Tax=Erysipelothrix larvae TaxID=1514105 RepID=A0A120JTH8_9FIRM|nr:hypothetical protein [Erysipelothrix larvae]AMC92928.1 hypothetical protein AOC36_02680 [Erysipelothrix larvae]
MKKRLNEMGVLLCTLTLAGFAGGLLINVGIGSDTVTVFLDGLSRALNISVGYASLLFNITIVTLGFLLAKKDMGWMSVAFSLGVGFFLDFFIVQLGRFNLDTLNYMVRILLVCVAQLSFALAYAFLIHFKSGMNPIDSIAYKLAATFKCSFKVARTGIDVFLITSGYLMGGVIGVGSLIAVLTTGILVSTVLDLLSQTNKEISKTSMKFSQQSSN